jgi:hypothetical protein
MTHQIASHVNLRTGEFWESNLTYSACFGMKLRHVLYLHLEKLRHKEKKYRPCPSLGRELRRTPWLFNSIYELNSGERLELRPEGIYFGAVGASILDGL